MRELVYIIPIEAEYARFVAQNCDCGAIEDNFFAKIAEKQGKTATYGMKMPLDRNFVPKSWDFGSKIFFANAV